MRHRAVGIAAAVAILAGGIAISIQVEGPEESVGAPAVAVGVPSEGDESHVDAERPTANKQPDIREMSQSFRHTTFLAAIRRAGFYCDDVVEAHESEEGLWVAGCRDLGGYKVSVGGVDVVRVEPIPHNVDAVF